MACPSNVHLSKPCRTVQIVFLQGKRKGVHKDIISRASKTTLLRSATLFAHACASAGECGARLMVCPSNVHLSKPCRTVQIVFLQGKRKGVYKDIISRASKTTLLRSATLFAHACASAGECGARLMACPSNVHLSKPCRTVQIVFLQGKRKGVYKDVHDRRVQPMQRREMCRYPRFCP